jgi:hypothetical protein
MLLIINKRCSLVYSLERTSYFQSMLPDKTQGKQIKSKTNSPPKEHTIKWFKRKISIVAVEQGTIYSTSKH